MMRFSLALRVPFTGLRGAFVALSIANYRWFFAGRLGTALGSYLGDFAENWLLVRLTHSGLWVSARYALFALPLLLLGPAAGRVADQVSRRRLLLVTQSAWMVNELALFSLAATGAARPWMVCAADVARGAANAFDLPARESFLRDLVDRDRVVSGVALKNTAGYVGQITGVAAAGLVIVHFAIAPCFAIDAGSCAVMIVALTAIKTRGASANAAVPGGDRRDLGQLLGHVRTRPALGIPLAALGVMGVLSLNLVVLVPLLASQTHLGASGYAALTIALGSGSAAGGLLAGVVKRLGPTRVIAPSAAAVGVLQVLAAIATGLPWQAVTLGLVSLAAAIFTAAINSHLLLVADQDIRGRVMALYGIGLVGSTTIGGPLVGWMTDTWSARGELLVAGAAAALTGLAAFLAFARTHRHGR
jgi:MFS family permease